MSEHERPPTMRRLKTIDRIYEEVRGYGLVITNDAPLATALNARVDTPRVGPFAVTPRMIAAELAPRVLEGRILSELELIREVARDTGLGFRQVYSEILNIREIRSHTMDVRPYLGSRDARRIFDSYSSKDTLERAMEVFDPDYPPVSYYFDREGGVAIVGIDLFDDLDKHFIPLDCDIIEVFEDGEYMIDTVYEVGNDRILAENAAMLVPPDKAEDFAMVLSTTSPVADAVRAALYRRGIPFVNMMSVRDLAQVRDYLGFMSLSLRYRSLRARDVRELFSNFNGTIKQGRDGYLLHRLGRDDMLPRASELQEGMRRIAEDGMTFGEVRDLVCNSSTRIQVSTLIKELGVEDDIVTPQRLSEVSFAVDNIQTLTNNEQIPDEERRGVLLADSKNSVFVDRPVVIYLGMEQSWNVPIIGKRYLDTELEAERSAMRLEMLVQQGQRRVYMANSSKNGKPARPSLTFDLFLRDEVDGIETARNCETFDAICGSVTRGRWSVPAVETRVERGAVEVDAGDDDRPFSKSSFDDYVACPRRYMFRELLRTPDATYTEFGNLVHEFAELYVCYPDKVNETGIEPYVDMVAESYAGLSHPLMEDLDRSRIRKALTNVKRYLDTRGVAVTPDVDVSTRDHPNRFMSAMGLDMTSDACETDRRSKRHCMHGKFDLSWNGLVIDYKTGTASDGKIIGKNMDLRNVSERPEFQPIMYLAIAQEDASVPPVFEQFYIMGRDTESSEPDFDIMQNVRRVRIEGDDVFDVISDPRFVEHYRSIVSNTSKDKVDAILDIVINRGVKDYGSWKTNETILADVVPLYKGKNARKDAETALSKLSGLLVADMVTLPQAVIIPRETVESFCQDLDSIHATMMGQIVTTLPAVPADEVDCRECRYWNACLVAVDRGGDDSE